MILSIDPGEHNGYALMETGSKKQVVIHKFGTMDRLSFYKWLNEIVPKVGAKHQYPIDLLLIEDWRTRPNEARKGAFDFDRMVAAQVIGAVEFLSVSQGIPLVVQQAAIKPIGYGFLGKPYKAGARGMHQWDAVAHGYYYFVTRKLGLPNSKSPIG